MLRSILFSLAILGLSVGFSTAEDKKADPKKGKEAKITKMEAKKGTVKLTTKEDGKDVDHTFKLAEEIEYVDSTGKVATVDIFTEGDLVLYVESEGTISKLKKCDKPVAKAKPESK